MAGVTETVRKTKKKRCPTKGKTIYIVRKAHRRKAYTRSDGTRVKAANVKRSSFCIKNQGSQGKRSRGARGGMYAKAKPWIRRKGKLGGKGYLSKDTKERRSLLRKCVRKYGYRSCLGSIVGLERSKAISSSYGMKLQADRNYVKRRYGGKGSFGKRK